MEATTVNDLVDFIIVSAHVVCWWLGFMAGSIR